MPDTELDGFFADVYTYHKLPALNPFRLRFLTNDDVEVLLMKPKPQEAHRPPALCCNGCAAEAEPASMP